MMTQYSTDRMIEDMLAAHYGNTVSERQKYLHREALHALVRLAKAEKLRDMRADARKLTGDSLPDLHHIGEAK